MLGLLCLTAIPGSSNGSLLQEGGTAHDACTSLIFDLFFFRPLLLAVVLPHRPQTFSFQPESASKLQLFSLKSQQTPSNVRAGAVARATHQLAKSSGIKTRLGSNQNQ